MKKLLTILLLVITLAPAKGQVYQNYFEQLPDGYTVAYKFHKDSTGFYVIKYEYNADIYSVPATLPPGAPHYEALITVYHVIENDTIMIGKSFMGTYVKNGCFEDVPADQVAEAKKIIINSSDTLPVPIIGLDTISINNPLQVDSIYFYPDTEITVPYNTSPIYFRTILITLEDLLDYQKECYNDSTEVGYNYTWNTEYFSDKSISSYMSKDCYCICSMYDKNINDYKYFDYSSCIYPEDFKDKMGFNYDTYKPIIYRTTLNLEGFIEYMKNKYNVK